MQPNNRLNNWCTEHCFTLFQLGIQVQLFVFNIRWFPIFLCQMDSSFHVSFSQAIDCTTSFFKTHPTSTWFYIYIWEKVENAAPSKLWRKTRRSLGRGKKGLKIFLRSPPLTLSFTHALYLAFCSVILRDELKSDHLLIHLSPVSSLHHRLSAVGDEAWPLPCPPSVLLPKCTLREWV